MGKDRFINVKRIQLLMKEINDIPQVHCKICGDTTPKHGFYPMMSNTFGVGVFETSSYTCNRCGRSDYDYEKMFGEHKEVFD